MSAEDIEGTIKILYDDDEVVKQSKQTSSAIGAMSKNVESDMKEISKSADRATDDLTDLGDKGKASLNKVADGADNAAQAVQDSALEVVALGETFAGVATQVFGFSEQLLSLERALFGIKNTAIGLEDLIIDFKIAMEEGTLSVIDQTRSIRDIQKEYANMSLEQKEAAAQALALNGEFVAFGISMLQTIAITGIMLKSLGLTDIAMVKTKLATIATSRVFKLLRFDLAGASIAMRGATLSLTGLRAGIRATTLALGPIGIAVIAITAAFTIWETNAFGIQEKLAELFETIQTLFPAIRLLSEAAASIFPPSDTFDATTASLEEIATAASAGADEFSVLESSTNKYTESVKSMTFSNVDAIKIMGTGGPGDKSNTLTGAFNSVGGAADGAANSLVLFNDLIFDGAGNLVDITKRADDTNIVFKKWQETLKGLNGDLKMQGNLNDQLTNSIKNQTTATKEQNTVLDQNLKKKQQSSLAGRAFEDLSREEQDQRLQGRTGIFSRSFGITPIGFRGQTFSFGGRNFRSRILARNRTLGGGAADAITAVGGNATRAAQRRVGTPFVIRESIFRAQEFRNSDEGLASVILSGRGGLTRSQSFAASRSGISSRIAPIREAMERGLITVNQIGQFLNGGGKINDLINTARNLIREEDTEIKNQRISSFSRLARNLGLSIESFIAETEQETVENFARLASPLSGLTQAQLLQRISKREGETSFQEAEKRRNQLSYQLAFQQRKKLIQMTP